MGDSDSIGIEIQMQRHPFTDVDIGDVDGLREHLREQLQGRHVFMGRAVGAARFFGDGAVELLELDGLTEPGQEAILVQLVVSLGRRDGIVRTFRDGEALVPSEGGGLRRAIGLLELMDGGEGGLRWWLTWRHAGASADGVGQALGDWTTLEGGPEDISRLPEGFDEWVDVRTARLGELRMGPETPNQPRMSGGLCAYSGPPPKDAMDAVRILAPQVFPEVMKTGFAHIHVFVLAEATYEVYSMPPPPPIALPDLVRCLVGRADGVVYAAAVALPTALNTPDGQRRGVGLTVEHDGERLLLFHDLVAGEGGRPLLSREGTLAPQGPVPEGEGWIGVPPTQEIDLTVALMELPGFGGAPADA